MSEVTCNYVLKKVGNMCNLHVDMHIDYNCHDCVKCINCNMFMLLYDYYVHVYYCT